MSEVIVENVGRTRIVTLNRPEARNALTRPVLHALRDAFETGSSRTDLRCIVLAGNGGNFCAGADLKKNLQDDPNLLENLETYLDEYHAVIKAMVHCQKPILGMLDGAAVGFGADLALACDLRVASRSAYIQEKFVKIGLMPDGGGSFWLPRLVGTARAMRMILLAEKLDAAKMQDYGIVMHVTDPEDLRATTMRVATELEAGPPLAYAEIRRAVYASWGSIEDALRREREGQLRLLRSRDAMEGITAWVQRREPQFQGE